MFFRMGETLWLADMGAQSKQLDTVQIWNIRKHVEATEGFETYSHIFYYYKILYFFLNIDKSIIG